MTEAETLNRITEAIIGAAIEVHRSLGPGLLESAYEACLAFELRERGLKVEQQKTLPVVYRTVRLDCGYRLDLLVGDTVIVELKAVDQVLPIHQAQMLSYLKLPGCSVGLIINFNVRLLKDGIKRIVNEFPNSGAHPSDSSALSAASAVNNAKPRQGD
jgi:GxxExxY protein